MDLTYSVPIIFAKLLISWNSALRFSIHRHQIQKKGKYSILKGKKMDWICIVRQTGLRNRNFLVLIFCTSYHIRETVRSQTRPCLRMLLLYHKQGFPSADQWDGVNQRTKTEGWSRLYFTLRFDFHSCPERTFKMKCCSRSLSDKSMVIYLWKEVTVGDILQELP